jgi:hypothetical protein
VEVLMWGCESFVNCFGLFGTGLTVESVNATLGEGAWTSFFQVLFDLLEDSETSDGDEVEVVEV